VSLIFTPQGVVDTERPVVEMNERVAMKLAIFAEVAGHLHWGLHCSLCKQDISGRNAREETQWQMDCGCRTYVGKNPLKGMEPQ
jgi:hypothetical protein